MSGGEGAGDDPPRGIIGWIWWAIRRYFALRRR